MVKMIESKINGYNLSQSRSSFLYWILVAFTPLISYSQVILIDPGHGGDDCGARAVITIDDKQKEVCEKDLALSISKKIQQELKDEYQVFLTRSVDRSLSLQQRADIADRVQADIFISVHLNASTARSSHGFETFYLNNHNNAAVKRVEAIENRDSEGDQIVINQILADLVIERTAPSSKKLANLIHQHINQQVQSRHQLVDRGVKPALFYVLALSKRPATLLEAGFITNDKEIHTILSEEFQRDYAKSVAKGVREYFKSKSRSVRRNLF